MADRLSAAIDVLERHFSEYPSDELGVEWRIVIQRLREEEARAEMFDNWGDSWEQRARKAEAQVAQLERFADDLPRVETHPIPRTHDPELPHRVLTQSEERPPRMVWFQTFAEWWREAENSFAWIQSESANNQKAVEAIAFFAWNAGFRAGES